MAIAYRRDDENDVGLQEWLIVVGVDLVLAAVLFWFVVRRFAHRPGTTGLVLGIVAVATLLVFWLGLPIVFAGAAALLGIEARERAREVGLGAAALVLAALAVVATVVGVFVA